MVAAQAHSALGTGDRLHPDPALAAVTHTQASRSRSKACTLRCRLRVLREQAAAAAFHQNGRCQARTGLCKAFYLAREGPVPIAGPKNPC